MQLIKFAKLKVWDLIPQWKFLTGNYTAICVGGIQFEIFNAPIANIL